ncbi:SWR1-complex protein 5 [Aspergillus lentulus]|nr:SWR1-complex protein 5 [Aspergillus lentulus]
MAARKYQVAYHFPSGGFEIRCYPQLARRSASPHNPTSTDDYRSKHGRQQAGALGRFADLLDPALLRAHMIRTADIYSSTLRRRAVTYEDIMVRQGSWELCRVQSQVELFGSGKPHSEPSAF